MKQVNDNIKKERVNKMLELSNVLENKYYNKFINKNIDVLIEEIKEDYVVGHTDNYIKVKINKVLETNKFYNIKIDEIVKTDVKGIYES